MRKQPQTREERATRDFVAFTIEQVQARLTAQAARILSEDGDLTPRQWWIIADMMAEQPNTATELAQIANIDKGLLSRNLKALKEKGLVEMRRDPTDQRQQIIALTEAGRRKHEELIPVMRARNEWLIREIGEEDLATAMDVLEKLERATSATSFPATSPRGDG